MYQCREHTVEAQGRLGRGQGLGCQRPQLCGQERSEIMYILTGFLNTMQTTQSVRQEMGGSPRQNETCWKTSC